jgi:hypothetical protein
MNFGPAHYVPALKIKRGEKQALRSLSASTVSAVTPLLEIVQIPEPAPDQAPKTLDLHLNTAFKDLGTAVQAFSRYFLDVHEIENTGEAGARKAFTHAARLTTPFTPVTGISRVSDVLPAIKAMKHGLALRLTRKEFEEGLIPTKLPAFLAKHGLVPSGIDLIMDIGCVDQMVPPGIADLVRQFVGDVPTPLEWRTFTVLGCAFPKSMAVLGSDTHKLVDRSEWLAWRDHVYPTRRSLPRLPTFGDCAIQRPEGVEGFNPRFMQVSAAVRYALDSQWLLIKGHSTDTTRSVVQFPRLGRQLVTGPLKAYFAGQKHCNGCLGIVQAAQGAPKMGSAEIWRRFGTIHHITNTVGQIQALGRALSRRRTSEAISSTV